MTPDRPFAKTGNGDCGLKGRLSRREQVLVLGLIGLVVAGAALWQPVQQTWLAYLLLRSDAPSPTVLAQLVDRARKPAELLERLWQTQKLPHRWFVLDYLTTTRASQPGLVGQMQSVLQHAAIDVDLEVREMALGLLRLEKHPDLRRLAALQLADADPAIRALGLQQLRPQAGPEEVRLAFQLLSDPDPRVVVSAAALLRQAIGQDFGLRLTHALPRFTALGGERPLAADLDAIAQGTQRAFEWWKLHQAEFPTGAVVRAESCCRLTLPAPNVELEDLDGTKVRLFDCLDRIVLVAFWDSETRHSLEVVPVLNALQQQQRPRLNVLGVALDVTAPERRHACNHGAEHGQGHEAAPDLATIRGVVKQTSQREQIAFRLLVDPDGAAAHRFKISEVPAFVFIDMLGNIQRWFVGHRTLDVYAAMLEEVVRAQQEAPP